VCVGRISRSVSIASGAAPRPLPASDGTSCRTDHGGAGWLRGTETIRRPPGSTRSKARCAILAGSWTCSRILHSITVRGWYALAAAKRIVIRDVRDQVDAGLVLEVDMHDRDLALPQRREQLLIRSRAGSACGRSRGRSTFRIVPISAGSSRRQPFGDPGSFQFEHVGTPSFDAGHSRTSRCTASRSGLAQDEAVLMLPP